VDDGDAVGIGDRATAPRAQIAAVAVEHDDRWILALEGVDAVARVGRHRADRTERPARGQLRARLHHLVLVAAAADGRHGLLLIMGFSFVMDFSYGTWRSRRSCDIPAARASLRVGV